MSRLAAIGVLAAFAAAPALAQEPAQLLPRLRRAIETRCSAAWPTNQRLKKTCIEKQVEAAREFIEVRQRYPEGSEEWGIVHRCLDRWVGEDGSKANFRMAVLCIGIEIDAYESLK